MMKRRRNKKSVAFFVAWVSLIILLIFLHLFTGIPLFSPSPYNTYTLQALAWRQGKYHLPEDVPYLELAVYQGNYYVSFPPVPSIPIYFLTFIFNEQVPDGILIKLYASITLYAFYSLLLRNGFSCAASAVWSFMLVLSSSILPLLLTGAVWYQAQVLALCLISCSITLLDKNHVTLGLLCFALSVGCRPFHVFYGIILLILFYCNKKQSGISTAMIIRRLLPGIFLGLTIAAMYAWYNCLRFHHPFEFGHNFLPEFSYQGGKQFSIEHLFKNIKLFVFGSPFELNNNQLSLKQFGFSLFVANPALLLLLFWLVSDAIHKKLNMMSILNFFVFFLHTTVLLLHRTFGGYQYGARYAVDLIPYVFIYLLTYPAPTSKTSRLSFLILLGGLLFAICGSLMIRL